MYMKAEGAAGTYTVAVTCAGCGGDANTARDPITCTGCRTSAAKSEISADGGHPLFTVFKADGPHRYV